MAAGRVEKFLSQDKAMLRLPRKSATPWRNPSSTRSSACYAFWRRRWPVFAVVAVMTSAAAGPSLGFGLNLSRSAPRGVYRAVSSTPTRGALVLACLPPDTAALGRARRYLDAGDCPGGAQPVLKTVGAVAGDIVELEAGRVRVNSSTIVERPIERLDSSERPLPHTAFGSYRVPPGEVWLFGLSDLRSWDSRYFGPVPMTAIRTAVRPVVSID